MTKEVFYNLTIAANCIEQLDDALSRRCYCQFNGGQLEKVLDDLYAISYFPTEEDAVKCVNNLREMGIFDVIMLEKEDDDNLLEYKLFVSKSNKNALYVKHNSLNGNCYADFIDEMTVEYTV